MKIRIPALLIIGALASGCSSPAAGPPSAPSAVSLPGSASATPAPAAPAAAAALTAVQVTRALKARGLPITGITVLTAAGDPNHLLGRPGEYTSKTEFADSRITGEAGQGVTAGGSVEVFTSSAGAMRRARYIQAIVQAAPVLGAEYDYVAGVVLLRVSGRLTPAQVGRYKRALAAITGDVVAEPGG